MATPEQLFTDPERVDNLLGEAYGLAMVDVIVKENGKLNDYLRERSVKNIELRVPKGTPGRLMRERGTDETMTYNFSIITETMNLEIEKIPADLDAFDWEE